MGEDHVHKALDTAHCWDGREFKIGDKVKDWDGFPGELVGIISANIGVFDFRQTGGDPNADLRTLFFRDVKKIEEGGA